MQLKKEISFFGIFSIATGAMISSGIFILPGLAFSKVGSSLFISYLLAGVLGFLGILSVIELATAMPKAGGDYFFISKTFGPLFGTISGFLGWLALSLKSAFAIYGLAQILNIYTSIPLYISTGMFILLFVIVNIVGVREASIVQIVLIIGLLTIMILYVIIGLPKINTSYFTSFFDNGINPIISTSGLVFISFGGLLKATSMSEEVSNPKRNIPLGIISSILVVTILYTLIVVVLTGVLPADVFNNSLTPVADSARSMFGNYGFVFIIIASSLAFLTTANAGIMAASRYPLALSNDRLIPRLFSKLHKRFNTPALATIITGAIVWLTLLLPLEMLVKAASTVVLTSYVFANLAIIILREGNITNYKPSFKAPLYPWLQLCCIVVFILYIVDLGKEAMEISILFLLISFCIYIFYGRKVENKESALLYVLKKIVDKRLVNNTLENELRDIIFERDDIKQDYADQLIKKSEIIDMDYSISFENLLKMITKKIRDTLPIDNEELYALFLERQKESNTALTDFVAIPHIIIDGKEKMFLYIVRNKEGVQFTENQKAIKAIFIIGGTDDMRHIHLKLLSVIAKIVSKKSFNENWLKSKNAIELRNLLLDVERKR